MRLKLVRHAPPLTGGRLAGRRDVDADCTDLAAFTKLRRAIGAPGQVICSPAQRCQQTATALGFASALLDEKLWEQNYGCWEGMRYEDLPDLGRLTTGELAAFCPEGGESFNEMAARAVSVFEQLRHDTLIIAHAGTVRAALSMVTGPSALSFQIDPLSLTVLCRGTDSWAVETVNWSSEV